MADAEKDALREVEKRIEAARSEHWQKHLSEHPHATGSSCPRDYGIHDAYAHAATIVREVIRENMQGERCGECETTGRNCPRHESQQNGARCPAHGKPGCAECSRITGKGLTSEGGCRGCSKWGAEGVHWDTCPERIRGDVYANREEALAAQRAKDERVVVACTCKWSGMARRGDLVVVTSTADGKCLSHEVRHV